MTRPHEMRIHVSAFLVYLDRDNPMRTECSRVLTLQEAGWNRYVECCMAMCGVRGGGVDQYWPSCVPLSQYGERGEIINC